MTVRVPSLRATFTGLTVLTTSAALVVATALVVLATLLHETTTGAAQAAESVRIAEEAQIDLLLLSRVIDPIVQRDFDAKVRRHMEDARALATTPRESEVIDEAAARLQVYLDTLEDPLVSEDERDALHAEAYAALETFVAGSIAQSEEARAGAERWNDVADALALATAAFTLFLALLALVWVRQRAFNPIYALADTATRFGQGDTAARAEVTGAKELRELSVCFNKMAEALAARHQAQAAFLAGVAHDLRTPLTAVTLSLAAIPSDSPLPSEQQLRRLVALTARQVAMMRRMIDDFVDVAAIEAGRLDLDLASRDLRPIVENAVAMFEGKSPQHPLVLDVAPGATLIARCDAVRIEQVLANLLSNAIKYSPCGGAVTVRAHRTSSSIILSVTDEGVGIAEHEKQELFKPFRRLNLSHEWGIPGVGLGLFVVRSIVEAHGGSIEVESAVGQGSTFRVSLPAAALPAHVNDDPARQLRDAQAPMDVH